MCRLPHVAVLYVNGEFNFFIPPKIPPNTTRNNDTKKMIISSFLSFSLHDQTNIIKDPARSAEIRRRGRELVERSFSFEKYIRRHAALYQRVLAEAAAE